MGFEPTTSCLEGKGSTAELLPHDQPQYITRLGRGLAVQLERVEAWSIMPSDTRGGAVDLFYERGSQTDPRGHAILYFWGTGQPARVLATYVIVLPIGLDLVKYMPPFLASQMPQMNAHELSAFAIPPMPEEVASHEGLESLAQARRDDLLFGGTVEHTQVPDLLALVNDLVQSYAKQYVDSKPAAVAASPEGALGEGGGASVHEVLYGLMGIEDRLAELSRLVGQLRFAVEGSDTRQAQEAEDEISALAQHLPDTFQVARLIRSARTPTKAGGDLAQLYLDRCYKLAAEDYRQLREIEDRISALEPGNEAAQP